ncbi:MAG: hypothetical protein M3R24_17255 [Chloroflexota bacterium]|nr:hypothetical protein [Chloroflexota bacterium]
MSAVWLYRLPDPTCDECGAVGLCLHRDRATVRDDLLPQYDAMAAKHHTLIPTNNDRASELDADWLAGTDDLPF